jgi:hypothetical protein
VAISPDVVSFVHDCFGNCDLLWRSGNRNVAREASSVSLATGTACNVACCTGVPQMMEAPGPSALSGGGFSFCAVSVGGLSALSSLPKRRRMHDQFGGGPPSGGSKLQEKGA